MTVIERKPGQRVRIGPYVLEVLAVHPDEVVFALIGPDETSVGCGGPPANRRCPVCEAEVFVGLHGAGPPQCPNCACDLE